MSDCCSSASASDRTVQAACPRCGGRCNHVAHRTLLHHLREPWHSPLAAESYFFCGNPTCELVYFGDNGTQIVGDQLRTPVGQKLTGDERLLCYCFGITAGMYRDDPSLKGYVSRYTREGQCACEIRNPSGRCCLKEFR